MKNVENRNEYAAGRRDRLLRSLAAAAGLSFLIFAAIIILRPFYLDHLNRDITLAIEAEAGKNDRSLADNVRVSKITVNGKDKDLSKIPLENGWQYDAANDFIYLYNAETAAGFTIKLCDVNTLSVEMVREVGAGTVRLFLDGRLWKNIDLYEDTKWDTTAYVYETSVFVSPEKHGWFLLAILVLAWILCFALMKRTPFWKPVLDSWQETAASGCLAGVLIPAIGMIQYGSIAAFWEKANAQAKSFLAAWTLLFLLLEMITFLTERLWIGFCAVSAVSLACSLASREKLLNRGTPLFPWDITMIREAARVASAYQISVTLTDVLIFAISAALTVLLFLFANRRRRKKSVRICGGIIFFAVACFFIRGSFFDTAPDVYDVNDYYEENGFVFAFVRYCSFLRKPAQPEGYSRTAMEEISQTVKGVSEERSAESPTIIAVMSESFWDIERVDTITFKEEVFPSFKALEKEGRYGELFTHVLNGGTEVSEFEFLTGFSGEFLPQDYMVYGNDIDVDFSSAVRLLKNQGYETVAIHPYKASNYNRKSAYQKLGFDRSFFDTDFEDAEMVRNYISDASLFDMVIRQYEAGREAGKPQFIFSVTMQNHGGYWENTVYEDAAVDFETDVYGEVARGSIRDYAAGLHESDRALGELADYFRNVDDDIILIYFGDHVSNAGPKDDRLLEKTKWAADSLTYDYETHKVPFLIWTNFRSESSDMGLMEVGGLLPEVFAVYGIQGSPFWQYRREMTESFYASDKRLVADRTGYRPIAKMTDAEKRIYHAYELLQYDYIWGGRYAADLWD